MKSYKTEEAKVREMISKNFKSKQPYQWGNSKNKICHKTWKTEEKRGENTKKDQNVFRKIRKKIKR